MKERPASEGRCADVAPPPLRCAVLIDPRARPARDAQLKIDTSHTEGGSETIFFPFLTQGV